MRRRAIAGFALVVFAGQVGCKSEQRLQHEQLAKLIDAPMHQLCRVPSREAGGCIGDCPIWVSAITGRAAAEASEVFVRVGRFPDAETETLLAAVRRPAEEVRRDLGVACAERIDKNAPLSPRVRSCAAAANKHPRVINELMSAATLLGARVSERASLKVPEPSRCAD